MPLQHILAKMELTGIRVLQSDMLRLQSDISLELQQIGKTLYSCWGCAALQVGVVQHSIFFDKVGSWSDIVFLFRICN